ncbi:MAG: hypothetical protein ACREKS_18640 [Candidatus Rokuibacteriota bacterium]
MKTHQCAIGVFALLLATGCASTAPKPAYTAFEGLPVPKGLEYRPADSTIIETQDIKAGRVIYRGRIEPESLAQSMRSTLEADGWRLVGSTLSAQSGSAQLYEKSGMSLQVRIWEGGIFSWYTYVELAAIEMSASRPTSGHETIPKIVPAPAVTPVPSAVPAPSLAPMPSASVESVTPASAVTR